MSKFKGGLGKGLSALIRPATQPDEVAPPDSQQPAAAQESEQAPEQHREGAIDHIEIARVRPNPFQPRADFDQAALDELKDSIRQNGIIQPITVRRVDEGMFELISGERRLRASQEIGVTTIPAYIIDVQTNEQMLELALVENLQREHLNPIEIAISYQRLMAEVNLSAEDVAQRISKDRTTVTNFLRLLRLPESIQQALRKGQLTTGHARALLGAAEETTQLRIFERIVKSDLSVRQVEKLVREVGKKPERPSEESYIPTPAMSAVGSIEEKMQQILGTRVRISTTEGGRGEILVEFYSNDDLERLFDLIATIRS